MEVRKRGLSKTTKKVTIAFMSVGMLQRLLVFLSSTFDMRFFNIEDCAKMSMFNSIYAIVGAFTIVLALNDIFGFYQYDENDEKKENSSSMLLFSSVVVGALSMVVALYRNEIKAITGLDKKLILLLLVALFLYPAMYMYIISKKTSKDIRRSKIIMIILALVCMLGSIMVSFFYNSDDVNNKILYSIVFAVPILVILYLSVMVKSRSDDNESLIYKLKTNAPFLPHFLILFTFCYFDNILINKYVDNEATTISNVIGQIFLILVLMICIINMYVIPWINVKLESEKYKEVKDMLFRILVGISILCIATILVAPEMIKWVLKESYKDVTMIIPFMVLSVFFVGVYICLFNVEVFFKNIKSSAFINCLIIILKIALTAFLLEKYGIFAAFCVTCFCYAILILAHYVNISRKCEDSFFDMRFFLEYTIGMIAVLFIITRLFEYKYVRLGLIVALFILLFLVRKTIYGIMYRIKKVQNANKDDFDYDEDLDDDDSDYFDDYEEFDNSSVTYSESSDDKESITNVNDDYIVLSDEKEDNKDKLNELEEIEKLEETKDELQEVEYVTNEELKEETLENENYIEETKEELKEEILENENYIEETKEELQELKDETLEEALAIIKNDSNEDDTYLTRDINANEEAVSKAILDQEEINLDELDLDGIKEDIDDTNSESFDDEVIFFNKQDDILNKDDNTNKETLSIENKFNEDSLVNNVVDSKLDNDLNDTEFIENKFNEGSLANNVVDSELDNDLNDKDLDKEDLDGIYQEEDDIIKSILQEDDTSKVDEKEDDGIGVSLVGRSFEDIVENKLKIKDNENTDKKEDSNSYEDIIQNVMPKKATKENSYNKDENIKDTSNEDPMVYIKEYSVTKRNDKIRYENVKEFVDDDTNNVREITINSIDVSKLSE